MIQYSIDRKGVNLKVKRAPFALLAMYSFITIIAFASPLIGVVLNLVAGNGFHIGLFFGLVIFGLLGFFLLRNTLWNAFGQETIRFENNEIEYVADYGWFKDKVKSFAYSNDLSFGIKPIGYEEDHKGTLIVSTSNDTVNCVTKMNIDELQDLISLMSKEFCE